MHSFLDNARRPWAIEITIGSIGRVDALLGVNLARLMEGEPPLLTRLDTDIALLCDVLYALVKPEADAREVTDEQFAASLGGDAIAAARAAFWEALTSFFQSLHRHDVVKAIQTQNLLVAAGVKAATAKMEQIDLAAAVAARIAAIDLGELLDGPTSGATAGSSPGSSASTPAA